jgi:Leucine-rich repeat (LRR) protein
LIENLDDEIFSSTNELKILKLEKNNLKKISENLFQNLKEIKEIYLQDNKIQKLSGEIFKNNEKLEILDLSHNELKFIDVKILEPLKSLMRFDFGENDCTKMTILSEEGNKVEVDQAEKIFEEFCGNDEVEGEIYFILLKNKVGFDVKKFFRHFLLLKILFLKFLFFKFLFFKFLFSFFLTLKNFFAHI